MRKEERSEADFFAMADPLSQVPREKLIESLVKIGIEQGESFPKYFEEVRSHLEKIDPLITMSSLMTYGMFAGVDDEGRISETYQGDKFNQSHIEVVQALYLRIPEEHLSWQPPTPDDIQKLFDVLPDLSRSFSQQRFSDFGQDRTPEEGAVVLLQEWLRSHTQGVRNWSFLGRGAALVRRLCEPVDDAFTKTVGFRATFLVDLFILLGRLGERRTNARWTEMQEIFQENTIEAMLHEYQRRKPHLMESVGEAMELVEKHNLSRAQVKNMLFSRSDLDIDQVYTFDVNEIAEKGGFDADQVDAALSSLSFRFGDLSGHKDERLFLSNPVWTKPVVALDGGRYFCGMPQAFFSFVFPILWELIQGNAKAAKRYEKRRAAFLEAESQALFKKAFPGCEIGSGYKWRVRNDEYENDLIVRVDTHVILVEAKSHRVSWPALRGAPDRARKHVEEILLAPSIQSERLEKRVVQVLADKEKENELLPNFPVSLKDVHHVLRLSVTLEDFATIQSRVHQVKGANWIPAEHVVAPCILLSDLEVVFDILESTPHKIHYLKRRADFERNVSYIGDELDLLGFYLSSGFNVGEAEFSDDDFVFTAMSQPIDQYYMSCEEGFLREKPQPKISQWWKDMCDDMESREVQRWSEVANILLGVSFSEQKKLEQKFEKVKKNVRKNWRIKSHKCSIAYVPVKSRPDALVLFAYRERHSDARRARMQDIASQIFTSSHAKRCVVIGVNIDQPRYPYSLMAVFFRDEERS